MERLKKRFARSRPEEKFFPPQTTSCSGTFKDFPIIPAESITIQGGDKGTMRVSCRFAQPDKNQTLRCWAQATPEIITSLETLSDQIISKAQAANNQTPGLMHRITLMLADKLTRNFVEDCMPTCIYDPSRRAKI